MPIKFRCQKCNQFLGISRSRAGQIVDCPACGRSTRVPNEDGTVDPLPEAGQIDAEDASLLNALDQLAQLNEGPPRTDVPAEPQAIPVEPKAAVVEPAPVALEPLAPVEVIEPDPPPAAALDSAVILEDLAEWSRAQKTPRVGRSARGTIVLVGLLAAVGGCLGGWFAARWWSDRAALPETRSEDAAIVTSDANPAGLRGRVTYRDKRGACLPDRDARVLVLPANVPAAAKLSSNGMRPGDPPEQFESAATAIGELGGAIAMVDENGDYHIPLQNDGEYRVLLLSRFASAASDDDAADLSALSARFSEPDRIIGRTRWYVTTVRFRSGDSVLLDHVF